MIICSHVARVSSTPTIITLDDGATFSNAHTGKVWGFYKTRSIISEYRIRALGFSDDALWISSLDVFHHYDQSQPRYRIGMRQDEMREMWADVCYTHG